MYELSHVTKNYQKGRRTVGAVRDLSLTVEDGEWLAVQGRTGHGKSTLLYLLGGLDRPSSGTISFDGRDLSGLPENKLVEVRCASFGYVFQTFNLVPTLSAAENVEAALVPMGVRGPERRRRVTAALESVGLADRMRHVPSELSGGQQQRVAIARAIVKEPKVLLADEPTGNLDEETRDDIIGLLEKLWLERGLTMILITHDSSVAKRAQRVGVMKNGNLSILRDSRRARGKRGQRADADREGPAAVGAHPAGEAVTEPEPAG
jgi:putative ABC transport system ATP-binding protein